MRTGIMGGTFNPIHNAHLLIAEMAREQYALDRVIFITSGNPPHKSGMADARHRFNMTRLAIADNDCFTDDDFEINRSEKSYTAHTLAYLREKYPSDELFFIVGEDSLEDLPKWYCPDEILKLCELIVFPRKSHKTLSETIKKMRTAYGGGIYEIDAPVMEISSTDIRRRLRKGLSVRYMLKPEIIQYIKSNCLYGECSMKEKLRETLSEKRYIHSIGVCKEAVRLAKKYGADEEKAYIAGLLHDCAKGYDIETQIEMCEKFGIELDSDTRMCPQVVHGILGAYLAEKEYGISDIEILNAIRYHTIGRKGMTTLEKIVYIADMTEENRDFDGVKKIRAAVDKSLDGGIIESIGQHLELLTKRKSVMHPNIIALWNDLISSEGK